MDRIIIGLKWEETKGPVDTPVNYRAVLYGGHYEELVGFTFTERKDFPDLPRLEIVKKVAARNGEAGKFIDAALEDDTAIYMDGSLVAGTPVGMRP